jgi:CRP/FNR family cyclic AMP-dependent transcriptional regulator
MKFRSTDPYRDYLRRVPLFERLADRDLDLVAHVATDLRLRVGDVIVREGDAACEMVILTSGTAEVTRGGDHVADLGPGAYVGELAVLTHAKRNSTVMCTSDGEAIHLTGDAFIDLLRRVPSIAQRMLPGLAARAG